MLKSEVYIINRIKQVCYNSNYCSFFLIKIKGNSLYCYECNSNKQNCTHNLPPLSKCLGFNAFYCVKTTAYDKHGKQAFSNRISNISLLL